MISKGKNFFLKRSQQKTLGIQISITVLIVISIISMVSFIIGGRPLQTHMHFFAFLMMAGIVMYLLSSKRPILSLYDDHFQHSKLLAVWLPPENVQYRDIQKFSVDKNYLIIDIGQQQKPIKIKLSWFSLQDREDLLAHFKQIAQMV